MIVGIITNHYFMTTITYLATYILAMALEMRALFSRLILKMFIIFLVTPSLVEPYPGWLDNLSSPVSICGGNGKGVLRVYYGPAEAPKAYVPVDFSTNSLMVSTWRQAKYVKLLSKRRYSTISRSFKSLSNKLLDTHRHSV